MAIDDSQSEVGVKRKRQSTMPATLEHILMFKNIGSIMAMHVMHKHLLMSLRTCR